MIFANSNFVNRLHNSCLHQSSRNYRVARILRTQSLKYAAQYLIFQNQLCCELDLCLSFRFLKGVLDKCIKHHPSSNFFQKFGIFIPSEVLRVMTACFQWRSEEVRGPWTTPNGLSGALPILYNLIPLTPPPHTPLLSLCTR